MLAREARLKKNKDFEQIFKKGKSVKGDFLLLKIVKNKLNKNRFAAIVSQKVSKKAIIRNKIRRRIAEIIRQKEIKDKEGYDVALIVFPGFEKKNQVEIKEILDKVFKKAKLI